MKDNKPLLEGMTKLLEAYDKKILQGDTIMAKKYEEDMMSLFWLAVLHYLPNCRQGGLLLLPNPSRKMSSWLGQPTVME